MKPCLSVTQIFWRQRNCVESFVLYCFYVDWLSLSQGSSLQLSKCYWSSDSSRTFSYFSSVQQVCTDLTDESSYCFSKIYQLLHTFLMLKVQILWSFFNGEAKAKPIPTVDTAAWSWEYSPPSWYHSQLSIIILFFFPSDLQRYLLTLIDNVSASLDLSLWEDKFILFTYTVPEAEEDTDASHLLGHIPS